MNKTKICCFNFVFWAAICGWLSGQEKNNRFGIFQNQNEYNQFMGGIKREGESDPELMEMVPVINDIVLGRPLGSTGKKYGVLSSSLGLLSDESIRKDLEIIDEQYEDLIKAGNEIRENAAAKVKLIDMTDMQTAIKQLTAIRRQMEDEIQSTLLPHQIDRLRQIALERQLRRRSLARILTSDPIREKIKMDRKQAEELLKAEKEIEAKLELEIEKLKLKAREQLLDRLAPGQRKQVAEIFGESLGKVSEIKSQ